MIIHALALDARLSRLKVITLATLALRLAMGVARGGDRAFRSRRSALLQHRASAARAIRRSAVAIAWLDERGEPLVERTRLRGHQQRTARSLLQSDATQPHGSGTCGTPSLNSISDVVAQHPDGQALFYGLGRCVVDGDAQFFECPCRQVGKMGPTLGPHIRQSLPDKQVTETRNSLAADQWRLSCAQVKFRAPTLVSVRFRTSALLRKCCTNSLQIITLGLGHGGWGLEHRQLRWERVACMHASQDNAHDMVFSLCHCVTGFTALLVSGEATSGPNMHFRSSHPMGCQIWQTFQSCEGRPQQIFVDAALCSAV
eukprot:363371-Chlamydomonas_euryale.AAC.17